MSDLGAFKPSLKILIIGPSWVGDMVLAQSLFKALKYQYTHAQIDVLAPAWSEGLLTMMPEVDRAINMPIGHGELNLKTRLSIANTLKKEAYDWAIILPNSFKSALIPWLANIPKRTGWRGEFRYGLLNDLRVPDLAVYPKTVERYTALANNPFFLPEQSLENVFTLRPQLSLSENSIKEVMSRFALDLKRPVWVLCPGAEFGPSKKWPVKYFKNIAQQHVDEGGQIWLLGTAADSLACKEIAQDFSGAIMKNFAGSTSLVQAVALLSQADKVITNDSGLMHVAAALSRPLVAVYGSTSEEYTPPLSKNSVAVSIDVSCRPCHKRQCPYGHYDCLEALKPERVIDAIQTL